MMNARIYNSIAIVFKKQQLLDSALYCYNISPENSQAIDWKKEIAAAYSNMANVYELKGEMEWAINYNKKSLQIEIEMNHHYGIMMSHNKVGRLYFLKERNSLAEFHINEAMKYALEERNYAVLKESYRILYKIYLD